MAYLEPSRLYPKLTAAAESNDPMLSSLLTNAVKYGRGASQVTARTDGAGMVEISLTDNGPGVPEAFRDHLLERFSRDADTAGKVMGTGLGLFITRELARANHGDVPPPPDTPAWYPVPGERTG